MNCTKPQEIAPKSRPRQGICIRNLGYGGHKKIKDVIGGELIGLVDFIWNNNKYEPLIEAATLNR